MPNLLSASTLNPGKLETYIQNTKELEEVFTALTDMVQIIDVTTSKPLYLNKSLLNLLSYSDEAIKNLGDNWPQKIIHTDDAPLLANHINKLSELKKNGHSRITYRAKNSKGKWRLIESINTGLAIDDAGVTQKVIGFTRDISDIPVATHQPLFPTESDEYEHRCKNCQKLLGIENILTAVIDVKCGRCGEINPILRNDLNTLFQTNAKKIYLTDSTGCILFVNDAVIEVSGYLPIEVIGKTPAIWGKQMSKDFYQNLYKQILTEKKSVSVTVTNKHKAGKKYEASVQISPILDEQGDVKYFIGIESEIK